MAAAISVVIPCHNSERYIAQTLASIREQTLTPAEVLLIDDGSTDDSVAIAEREYPGVMVIPASVRNAGAARNIGIERAASPYVAFLDADDWWYPGHLESAAPALASGDAAYLGHRDFVRQRGEDEWVTEPSEPLAVEGERRGLAPELFFELFLPSRYYASSGLVARREALLDGGLFDARFKRRHDVEMFLRLIRGRTWACGEAPSWAYRVGHAGTISSFRAECEWYLYRVISERAADYPSVDATGFLDRLAKVAMGAARRSGDRELLGRVAETVWPRLSAQDRAVYLLRYPRTVGRAAAQRGKSA